RGYGERMVYDVATGFDWSSWLGASQTQSLFADRQLIELRLPSGKPGDAGVKALLTYMERLNPANLLLIITGKLDSAAHNGRWFKAVEAAGVVITVWPLTLQQLPPWLNRRAQAQGLQLSPAAIGLLVERVEGNPLAAAQELDKLYLLHGASTLDEEQVAAAVVDSARFDVYGLVDCLLEGNQNRAARILVRLAEEGVEPILILWAVTRELRLLVNLADAQQRGERLEQACGRLGVWDKRKPLVTKALKRHPLTTWRDLLLQAGQVDRVIKGNMLGSSGDALLRLTLAIAGRPLFVNV
ncbi:MAG: DNA polymerase III subunit delta, partial [Halothiobacillaceae bacterium]